MNTLIQFLSENLAMSFQMKLTAMEKYPDFTRKSYIDAYQYNLHLCPRSMLVELFKLYITFHQ
ncbi:MAG: hypothetical protein GX225_04545 [Clostridiales bacterium]|nr:hypothetical protein [Clostridiales bacterium]